MQNDEIARKIEELENQIAELDRLLTAPHRIREELGRK